MKCRMSFQAILLALAATVSAMAATASDGDDTSYYRQLQSVGVIRQVHLEGDTVVVGVGDMLEGADAQTLLDVASVALRVNHAAHPPVMRIQLVNSRGVVVMEHTL